VQRGKVGAIVERFENKGMQLKGLKTFQCTRAIAEEHYRDLSSKPFFKDLVDYIISGPVVCMIWQGPTGTVAAARKMIGETNPLESLPGSIRGDYAVEVGRNIIHGSDSVDSAEREINCLSAATTPSRLAEILSTVPTRSIPPREKSTYGLLTGTASWTGK